MKLRYSPTSPYVRKVTVSLIEIGLDHLVERLPTNVWDPASDIVRDNPLGKVPALITDDGLTLIESTLICEYLDSLPHAGPKLFPADGPTRWPTLQLQALASGALDAGIVRFLEMRRPPGERSTAVLERQRSKLQRTLDLLNEEVRHRLQSPITIAHIAVGCLLGWLDFRCPQEDWRGGRSALSIWYLEFMARRSMQATVPKEA